MKNGLKTVGLIALAALAACSGPKVEQQYPSEVPGTNRNDPFYTPQKYAGDYAFSKDGNIILGGEGKGGAVGIGVNSFLWRASLDTIGFMPLASADPFGGVIITEWYTSADAPDERFKMTIYILDTELRADGLRVNVFRQKKDASGTWVDVGVSAETPTKIENSILTRARELKVNGAG